MSAVWPLRASPPAWRASVPALLLVLVAALAIYRDAFSGMVAIWSRSDTFAHAFLVPPIAFWLIWRRRDALRAAVPRPQPWLLLPVAVLAFGWLVGELAGANAVTQACSVLGIVLAVPALLGVGVARLIAFPLAFLLFMVPTGEFVMPTLMQWTADVTVASLRALGIPVYREGLTFVIPSGTWSVIEACSGVRYLIASFMVGTLFAYLQYRSTARRIVFSLVALAVPIVANWARAVIIVLLGHLSNNRLAAGVDHLIYGWVFFGAVISLMFVIGARWSESPAAAPAPPPVVARGGAGAGEPILLWGTSLALVLVWAAPQVALGGRDAGAPLPQSLALPALAASPAATAAAGEPFEPIFEGATAQATRTFETDAGAVTVQVAYYRHQAAGRKLASSENMLTSPTGKVWRGVAAGERELAIGDRRVTVRTAEVRRDRIGRTAAEPPHQVRQVLWADGRLTGSATVAALYAVRGELLGRGDDAAAITFSMPGSEADATGAALDAFVERHTPALATWLDGLRARR